VSIQVARFPCFAKDYISSDLCELKPFIHGYSLNIDSKHVGCPMFGFFSDDVFYRRNMIVIPSGFIVPTKNVGQVSVFDLDGDKVGPFNLIPKSDGTWFYHRVIWVDMDGDSLLDAVTCRAHKPLFGKIFHIPYL